MARFVNYSVEIGDVIITVPVLIKLVQCEHNLNPIVGFCFFHFFLFYTALHHQPFLLHIKDLKCLCSVFLLFLIYKNARLNIRNIVSQKIKLFTLSSRITFKMASHSRVIYWHCWKNFVFILLCISWYKSRFHSIYFCQKSYPFFIFVQFFLSFIMFDVENRHLLQQTRTFFHSFAN